MRIPRVTKCEILLFFNDKLAYIVPKFPAPRFKDGVDIL
jgi:hypothetical protein